MLARKWNPRARKPGDSDWESTLGLEHGRNPVFDAAEFALCEHSLLQSQHQNMILYIYIQDIRIYLEDELQSATCGIT